MSLSYLFLDCFTLLRITSHESGFSEAVKELSQSAEEGGALGACSAYVDSDRVDDSAVDDGGAAFVANKSDWGMGINAPRTGDHNISTYRVNAPEQAEDSLESTEKEVI